MKTTNQIYEELRKSVIGQDEYLRELATISYKHLLKQKLIENGKNPINTNMLVIGPSGCGKTFAAKRLAKLIDVPFFEIDCSNLVQVGYKGSTNLEEAIGKCVDMYKADSFKAIIYLDEFDKILDLSLLKDGKGSGSQQNFLKYLENNTVTITRGDRYTTKTNINTAGLTFIATGSFEMVKQKIRENRCSTMGFKSKDKQSELFELNSDDLIEFGYLPELIGRFNRIININQLTEDDFYQILKTSDDSIYSQYQDLYKADGIKLQIRDKMFKHIAHDSFGTSIGARGMDKNLSEVLDKTLFDVSNNELINSVVVDYVNNKVKIDYTYGESRKVVKQEKESQVIRLDIDEIKREISRAIDDADICVRNENRLKREFNEQLSQYNNYIILDDYIDILHYQLRQASLDELNGDKEYSQDKNAVCKALLNQYMHMKDDFKEEK